MSEHVLFPAALGTRGRMATGGDEEYLRGLVEQVLFTRAGERVNRPEFGCGLAALVFEPSGDELVAATGTVIRATLQDALGTLIRVEDVTVTAEDSTLAVTVAYTPLDAPAGQPATVVRVANAMDGTP